MALAERLKLEAALLTDIFYVALLHGLGCVADAHDAFTVLGADDPELRKACQERPR